MSLERLLRPKSIAIIGGGAWCEAVLRQCVENGFSGPIYPVHPKRVEIMGFEVYSSVKELPSPPDASFIGVNRFATLDVVRELNHVGGGSAVCFASGFQETKEGERLNEELIAATGNLTILGPNCYGLLNYLDGACLWPDVQGGKRVEKGVAIIAQSSNIALNLTMQNRGLPLAFLITVGNQTMTGLSDIGLALLDDDRVTALGFYVEGFGDVRALEAMAAKAESLGKAIIMLKAGASEEARSATLSHTASLAGSDAGASALIERLGIARVFSLPVLLESLKIAHGFGKLTGRNIASLSCSGGEASLIADTAKRYDIPFPRLKPQQKDALSAELNEMVSLTNPLDYHTFIWRDFEAMAKVFHAMSGTHIDLTIIVLDFPKGGPPHHPDWLITLNAIEEAARNSARPFAVLSSLGETMPADIAEQLLDKGIVPLCGFEEAMQAIIACQMRPCARQPALLPLHIPEKSTRVTLDEGKAKQALSAFGVPVPLSILASADDDIAQKSTALAFPVAVKARGLAHKTEAGGVALLLNDPQSAAQAARKMAEQAAVSGFLLEEMVVNGLCELLVGVVRDEAHGFVLTLAAGGVHTEILQDRQSLLLPVTAEEITAALNKLKIAPLLQGYRNKPGADFESIIKAIFAVQDYVTENHTSLYEVEINPLIVTSERAIAVDALITLCE